MPRRARQDDGEGATAPVRSFWSGTITFGLVSIPVDLLSAVRPRQTAMKMVDKHGHALGRQYHCSAEGRKLSADQIVRGYETDSGEVVVITDEEFERVAPEMSRDIELRRFVPLEQIPPVYYDRPYFLAPAGTSVKAYHLLAMTMERTSRVAIGRFVMRGHEYLVAILSENGVLRAETLRHSDEIRTPESVGLPRPGKVAAKKINSVVKEIEALTQDTLDMSELEDREAEALQALVQEKRKSRRDVIEQADLEEEVTEGGGAEIIDLMQVLKRTLSKEAVVTTARETPPRIPRGRAAGHGKRQQHTRKSASPRTRAKGRRSA